MEQVMNDPIQHWVKMYVLKDSAFKLKQSNAIAKRAIHAAKVKHLTREITKSQMNNIIASYEEVLVTNYEEMMKVNKLMDVARRCVPKIIREWPSFN